MGFPLRVPRQELPSSGRLPSSPEDICGVNKKYQIPSDWNLCLRLGEPLLSVIEHDSFYGMKRITWHP